MVSKWAGGNARLKPQAHVWLCLWLVWLLAGCATVPIEPPSRTARPAIQAPKGSYHYVQRGETLWRIAHSYGVAVNTLTSVNRLSSASQLNVGQRLYIPLPDESVRFLWPVRGAVASPGAARGIRISATPGSLIRASRTGRVAVATRQLAGWGKTIVLDHFDGYVTIYSGLDQILVAPGTDLRQGMPVGTLGTGALHFEIRYGVKPRNTLALLPGE